MSYNIDNVDATLLGAKMTALDIVTLHNELEGDLPEVCFLHDRYDEAQACLEDNEGGSFIELEDLNWCGEGSGRGFDVFKEHIAPAIMGKVEAVLTWEGGDSMTGFFIDDGVYDEANVKVTLERMPKTKKKAKKS